MMPPRLPIPKEHKSVSAQHALPALSMPSSVAYQSQQAGGSYQYYDNLDQQLKNTLSVIEHARTKLKDLSQLQMQYSQLVKAYEQVQQEPAVDRANANAYYLAIEVSRLKEKLAEQQASTERRVEASKQYHGVDVTEAEQDSEHSQGEDQLREEIGALKKRCERLEEALNGFGYMEEPDGSWVPQRRSKRRAE
ncbi:hypothetical protein SLS60_011926 [Paraconiothyrium brasiliense]|uniref:Uncharacterized protein n=1 Tax=Paraconiothyrium brasiliense TaxID=300254 RepID=A0ABR3QH92_9PLEO